MYISDTEKKRAFTTAVVYLSASVFCGAFSAVYESFSHGVMSGYMIWMFTVPLALGALPFGAIALIKKAKMPGRLAFNIYNAGVATLTAGMLLSGIFEIFGTSVYTVYAYFAAGGAAVAAALIMYIVSFFKKEKPGGASGSQ